MRTRLLLLTFIATILAPALPGTAHACSCLAGGTQAYFDNASLVFAGTVEAVAQDTYKNYYSFSVQESWKGDLDDTISVSANNDQGVCGTTFTQGETYVIFATKDASGAVSTSLCSGNEVFSDDSDTVIWLRSQDPAPSCEPYVCEDESTHPSCTDDGHVINYFADPCLTHGGYPDPVSSSSSSSSSSRPASSSSSSTGPVFIGTPALAPFKDVSSRHPYSEAIGYVQEKGIVSGYSDGTYHPDSTINRAELLKILTKAAFADSDFDTWRAELILQASVAFSDVQADAWYAVYVCLAKEKGIVSGYPDGTFRADKPVTYGEAAKMVVNTFSIPQGKPSTYWWQPFITGLKTAFALPPTYVSAGQQLNRGEMAFMVWKVLEWL